MTNTEGPVIQQRPGGHGSTALPPGTPAPDFSLHSTPDQTVQLREFSGQPIVLAFYPADWSPVCGDQMALYNEILPEFQRLGAELIGISVDGSWCHAAFSRDRKLHFPLLADFEPKGAQGRFWEMHDLLYEHQDGLEDEDLARYATALGLDAQRLISEVLSGAHSARVQEDFRSGARGGVNGTPTLFINGVRYAGAPDVDDLVAALTGSGA